MIALVTTLMWRCLNALKGIVSIFLLLFSIYGIVVGVGHRFGNLQIPTENSAIDYAFLLFVFALLAANEGYQVGALRIQNLDADKDMRQKGFFRAAKIHRLLYGSVSDLAHEKSVVDSSDIALGDVVENEVNGHNHRVVRPKSRENSEMGRLFIGQSFLVVFCSFTIANMTTFPTFPALQLIPGQGEATAADLLIRSGFPGIFFTLTMVQLLPSLIAKQYPVQFLNIPGIFYIIKLALFIESAGIVQFVYVVVAVAEGCCCGWKGSRGTTSIPIDTSDSDELAPSSPNSRLYNTMTAFKYIFSSTITAMSLTFIIWAIFNGLSTFPAPIFVQFGIFFVAIALVFYFEGIKVAVVVTTSEAQKIECSTVEGADLESPRQKNRMDTRDIVDGRSAVAAAATAAGGKTALSSVAADYHLLHNSTSSIPLPLLTGLTSSSAAPAFTPVDDSSSAKEVSNASEAKQLLLQGPDMVEKFLLGRQQLVVPLGFLVAQLTNFGRLHLEDPTLQFLVVTLGVPGMLVLLQFSQLAAQIVAQAHPQEFLGLPGGLLLIRLCLAVEMLGIAVVTTLVIQGFERLVGLCCADKSRGVPWGAVFADRYDCLSNGHSSSGTSASDSSSHGGECEDPPGEGNANQSPAAAKRDTDELTSRKRAQIRNKPGQAAVTATVTVSPMVGIPLASGASSMAMNGAMGRGHSLPLSPASAFRAPESFTSYRVVRGTPTQSAGPHQQGEESLVVADHRRMRHLKFHKISHLDADVGVDGDADDSEAEAETKRSRGKAGRALTLGAHRGGEQGRARSSSLAALLSATTAEEPTPNGHHVTKSRDRSSSLAALLASNSQRI